MIATRLWYFFQAAAQDSPQTYGFAPELYAPGGWELWWRSGIRGSPPGEVLSECQVPLIIQNWTGQVAGKPTQCRVCELPSSYMYGMADMLTRYKGVICLHSGALHNSTRTVEDIVCIMELLGFRQAVRSRLLETYWCQDAPGEAGPYRFGTNTYLAHRMFSSGFMPAIEGGTPTRYAGIMPVRLNLWQRSALLNMVNNPKARKGIAPLDENVENVVWIDDATLATPEEHVYAAEQVKAGGVVAATGIVDGVTMAVATERRDPFQQSAARPLSAAISVGMDGAKVREIWGKGAAQ